MFWQTNTFYEFGPFRVDARERRLLRNNEVVPLKPKIFDVLLVLVQNSGRLLTKDEVMKLVWPTTAVEEGNVARNISTLRNALGEQPREHQYIETVPWRGYRFVANVKEVRDSPARPPIDSIAVLPFVNVNTNSRCEYLSDGITESLITSLAQLTNLRVTSRNSAFRYKGHETNAQAVGRELKVQAVLMGRVAESDDLLSISVELVETSDDRHIWGAQYVRKPGELFAAQENIARDMAEKLRLELTGDEKQLLTRRHTENNEAYLLYLKGRFHFNKLTPGGVQKGVEYFQQAVEKDPNYALAYAGLGDCHNYLAHRDEAKKAVLKALELDERLGEAHGSLGFFRFLYDWDFTGAESEFERALALSPNYAEAHHWYAIYLANLGRHEEADREARRAIELDPLSLLMNMTPALNFYLARRYDRAIEQLQRVIEMEPNFVAARSVLGSVLVQKALYEEAMAEYQKVLELIKGAAVAEISVKAIMAHAFARWAKRTEAIGLLDEVIAAGTASPYSIAGIYAALGDGDSAFEWLHKAREQHDVQLVSMKVDPTLDGVRSDPRFTELTRRVGFL
ncbi:MAG: winged helix-turn-helix domain-containing protein [Acidobacteriota bacterium]|nr:winged helix-turn-helix domain-containing protein [Acidobacteriota bacterium]